MKTAYLSRFGAIINGRRGRWYFRSVQAWIFVFSALLLMPSRAALGEPASWATLRAKELSNQGSAHAAQGNPEVAMARFREAISFDASYGPAYLGLSALLEQNADLPEAERTLSMGIERVPHFVEAFRKRRALRQKQKRMDEAVLDAEAAAQLEPDSPEILMELSDAYIAGRAFCAALAVARRIALKAELDGDAPMFRKAKLRAAALAVLAAEADPVLSGSIGRGWVRGAIALGARHQGQSATQ